MLKSINGAMFRKMILAGASLLDENKKYIDSLNVFPVPDGDTGTNMSMTMKSVVNEINNCQINDINTLASCVAKGALKGARGNSGVILSQILKGMCVVFAEEKEITPKVFAKAITKGSEVAYQAVTKPKEGTILTVISSMAEASVRIAKKTSGDLETFLKQVIEVGDEALKNTPELLPVLKKAGVVDSGGQGLMIVFAGFYKVVINDEKFTLKLQQQEESALTNVMSTDAVIPNPQINYENLADIEFGYCTEFMIIEMKKKTTLSDIDMLRNKLMEIGDSVLCIGDLSLVKVHVHTNEPNLALSMALELGELNNIKIENMREENRELKRQRKKREPEKDYAFVSICSGDGISQVFKDLGVDICIEGGQTMNPSSNDIAKAIEEVNAKHVFILPNNKNIIMAAEQAKDLTDKPVHVVPTTNIPQGITAILNFDPTLSIEESMDVMVASTKTVRCGSVTYAVRKTHISGFDLDIGDIIGLDEHDIVSKDKDIDCAVEKLIEKINSEEKSTITIYYGNEIQEDNAEKLGESLREKYPDKDVTVINGGQPVYYYLISLE